jgi:hypothetical protein
MLSSKGIIVFNPPQLFDKWTTAGRQPRPRMAPQVNTCVRSVAGSRYALCDPPWSRMTTLPKILKRLVDLDGFNFPATALPLASSATAHEWSADELENRLAALGYPGFAHRRTDKPANPTDVVLGALVQRNLDTRLVEALPWVLAAYRDLDWHWLRDQARLRNAQNRLGYTLHLALQLRGACDSNEALRDWECELEAARLAGEGTLCRDSMPERERVWLRVHRPKAARHWNLLTTLTAEQLRNVEASNPATSRSLKSGQRSRTQEMS